MANVFMDAIGSQNLRVLSKSDLEIINKGSSPVERFKYLLDLMQEKKGKQVDTFVNLLDGFPLMNGVCCSHSEKVNSSSTN